MSPPFLFAGPSEVLFYEPRQFDRFCMFGNDMVLNEQQMNFLDHYCGDLEEIHMKFYVHRMNNSNIIPNKCKMVRLNHILI